MSGDIVQFPGDFFTATAVFLPFYFVSLWPCRQSLNHFFGTENKTNQRKNKNKTSQPTKEQNQPGNQATVTTGKPSPQKTSSRFVNGGHRA